MKLPTNIMTLILIILFFSYSFKNNVSIYLQLVKLFIMLCVVEILYMHKTSCTSNLSSSLKY